MQYFNDDRLQVITELTHWHFSKALCARILHTDGLGFLHRLSPQFAKYSLTRGGCKRKKSPKTHIDTGSSGTLHWLTGVKIGGRSHAPRILCKSGSGKIASDAFWPVQIDRGLRGASEWRRYEIKWRQCADIVRSVRWLFQCDSFTQTRS